MKQHNSSDVNESSYSTTSTSGSVKDILRRKIAQKQAQQNKELASKAQDNSTLTYLIFFCEVRSIVYRDLFPLLTESTVPSSALIIEQSRNLQFSPSTGPFQPVKLL